MLPFFRKIRYRLAKNNQFFKYSRYAVGEIVLVVIGILIALQINNWNEDKKRNNSLKGHLKSLTQAIEHDIREQNISMGFNEFRFHSWNYILNVSGVSVDTLKDIPRPNSYIVHTWDGPYPMSIDKSFINTSLNQLISPFIDIYFNYSAIDEINNLGVLADLDNDSLKKSINDYYYNLNWRFGMQSADDRYQMAKELRVYLRDYHGISCNFATNPELVIKAFREDQKANIMLKDLIKTVHSHYWVTEKLRDSAIDLIDSINKELNN